MIDFWLAAGLLLLVALAFLLIPVLRGRKAQTEEDRTSLNVALYQDRPADAARAYEQAVKQGGREPELLGQWAQALYFASQKKLTPEVKALTEEALKADPNEITSLGLLGIAGFEDGRFQDAIGYWERLIVQLPPDDPSRGALQGGIDKAREKLKESGVAVEEPAPAAATTGAQLKVRVDLAGALKDKVQPGDSVFIFARATSGPPMPLAVKRMTVADLPVEVALSDADAMMPQLKLSNFPQVQLVARISRGGNATAGEWIGRSSPLSTGTSETQRLTIDSPDEK